MKRNKPLSTALMATLTLALTSCTLFIDDDKLLLEESPLPTYTGNGYDAPVTEKYEYGDVTYQLNENTLNLNAVNELTNYILRTDTVGNLRYIYFDKSVPQDLLPKQTQLVVSDNKELFGDYLCHFIYDVSEEDNCIKVSGVPTNVFEAYKEFKVSLHPDLNEYFRAFNVYDEDDNLLGTVNQDEVTEEEASSPNHIKGGPRKEEGDKPYSWNFSTVQGILDKYIKPFLKGPKMPHEDPLDHTDKLDILSIGGGLKFPETKGDFNLNPFSSDDLHANVDIGEGYLDLFLDLQFGAEFTKWAYLRDSEKLSKMLDKIKIAGVDINLNAGIGIDADLNLIAKPRLNIPFGNKRIVTLDKKVTDWGGKLSAASFWWDELGVSGDLYFPELMINIGFGKWDVFINGRLYLKPHFQGHVDFLDHSYVQGDFEILWSLAISAKGRLITKILNKIRNKIEKKFPNLNKILKKRPGPDLLAYIQGGTLEDWAKVEDGVPILTEVFDRMKDWAKSRSPLDAATFDELYARPKDDFDRQQMFKKIKEQREVYKGLADKEKEKEKKKYEESTEGEAEKNPNTEFSWELGPWEIHTFPLFKRYMTPKAKKIKVGVNWDNDEPVYTASFKIEDVGVLTGMERSIEIGSEVYTTGTIKYKPGFIVMLGKNVVDSVESNIFIAKGSEVGSEIKAQLTKKFNDGKTYVCVPFFREYVGDYPTTTVNYENGKAFSSVNPSIAITKFKVTSAWYDENAKPEERYCCNIKVFVNVNGLSLIDEWGLVDNFDTNEKTKYHTNEQAASLNTSGKKSGEANFSLTFTLKSYSSAISVSLQPYVVLSGQKNKKLYHEWGTGFDMNNYMQSGSSTSTSSTNEYTLTLDSVDFIPEEDTTDWDNSEEGSSGE